jgi:hypothetical protein
MSLWEQLADHPESTCAQVIHSRTEAFGNNRVPMITTTECERQDNELGMHYSVCSNHNLTSVWYISTFSYFLLLHFTN